MTGQPKEQEGGGDFGFDDALGDVAAEFESWTPGEAENDVKRPDPDQVKAAAKAAGFTSREPAPEKEPSDQVSIRGRKSVIDRFKALCDSQTPKWPQGYALERALDALEKEMKG